MILKYNNICQHLPVLELLYSPFNQLECYKMDQPTNLPLGEHSQPDSEH